MSAFRFIFLVLSLLALQFMVLAADEIRFPADGILADARECGAKGDGVTDDTAALNAAFAKGGRKMGVVYIPAGTYLVSGPLASEFFWTYVQGAGRDKTIIRLKDNCAKFQDPKSPLWLMCNLRDKSPCKCWIDKATGCNIAFDVQINDLTLDTGSGNPGAVGLHYICNNTGGIKNVTIRSSDGQGVTGLDMRHPWPGPCLIKGVKISGFDYGVRIKHATYHDTFEDLTLENQKVAGFLNQGHPVSMRKLVSRNIVPAIVSEKGGQIVLLESKLSGGSSDICAIKNSGSLYLRDCEAQGYKAAVEHAGRTLDEKSVKEWFSEDWNTLFPTEKRSLGLPIKETPEFPYEPLDRWESVARHADKVVADDWGPAIQAAIDSGKSTIYFPKKSGRADAKGKEDWSYPIRSTVVIRGNVRVIQGCGAAIKKDDKALGDKPAFRIDAGIPDTVFFEKLTWEGKGIHIEHASRTLVVQQCRWQRIGNAEGCGDLFVDCWGGSGTFKVPQKVWVRALNMEAHGPAKMVNQAGTLWVLGLKTEGDATNIHNLPGGTLEVLGGLIYPAGGDLKRVPGFINEGGTVSIITTANWANKIEVKETVGGETRTLPDTGRFWNYVFIPQK